MTRVPGQPVDRASLCAPEQRYGDAPQDTSADASGVSYYGALQTRFAHGFGASASTRLSRSQLARLAARKRALKQRRRGGGDIDDDVDEDVMPDRHARIERRGGTTGDGGGEAGGQSHHGDDSGADAEDSVLPTIKAMRMQPVPPPQPGVLTARVAKDGASSVSQEQLAEAWCASLVSLRDALLETPDFALGPAILEKEIDLFNAKLRFDTWKPLGWAFWRQKLIAELGAPDKTPKRAAAAARMQSFYAQLPLLAHMYDAPPLESRIGHSINRGTIMHGASLVKQRKR